MEWKDSISEYFKLIQDAEKDTKKEINASEINDFFKKQLEEDIKTFAQVFERKMRESIFVIIAKTVVGDRVIACFGDKYTIDEMFDLKAKLPQKYYTATMDEYKISQSEVYNNKLYNKIKELIFKKKSK